MTAPNNVASIRRTCRAILARAGDPLTLRMEVSNYLWQAKLGGSLSLVQYGALWDELVLGKDNVQRDDGND